MQITRTAQRNDNPLSFSDIGDDILIINGETFDFSALIEGEYVPVPCDWIVGPVRRENGEICLTLIEPYGPPPQPETPEADDVEA